MNVNGTLLYVCVYVICCSSTVYTQNQHIQWLMDDDDVRVK